MTDLRDRLRVLDGLDVPDVHEAARAIGPKPPDRSGTASHARRFGTIVVALAVGLAALSFLFIRFQGGRSTPAVSPEPTPTQVSAAITQTIDTGQRFPEGVAVGEGGVWVVTKKADVNGGDLLRLDPVSGEIVSRIPMPSIPGWEFGGGGIATGLGGVWVVGEAHEGNDGCCDIVVRRVDPTTNTIAETIHVGPGYDSDVWVDASGIWVLGNAQDGSQHMWLYRLDGATHEVVTKIQIPAFWSQTVFGAGGWIWVFGSARGDAPAETLYRIDPSTNEIVDTFSPSGAYSFPVAPSGDVIWFAHDGLRALDAFSGEQIVGPIQLPVPYLAGLVPDGSGGVWVIGEPDVVGTGIWHLRADGRVDASAEHGPDKQAKGIAAAFDPSTNSVWIVHSEDTVSRLQITPT
jgi:hypothetical protein